MKTKKQKTMHLIQYVICVFLLTALDQWTKMLAVRHLKDQSDIVLIPGVLNLHYLENRGAAFGMMQGRLLFFLPMTLLVLCGVLYVVWKIPTQKKYSLLKVLCFIISAGALGNFIDRVRLNYVVDFIYVSLIDFPVFNVADIYVVVSVILFLIVFLFYYKDEDFTFLKRSRSSE